MISRLAEKRLKRDLFRLSIITLLTVVFWIGIETYRAFVKKEIKPEIRKQILPLTSTIDLDTMNNVKQRLVIPPADWSNLKPVLTESVVLPESSVSGELKTLESTASASQSAF